MRDKPCESLGALSALKVYVPVLFALVVGALAC